MDRGTWELRVHGVAGTPASAMLELKEVPDEAGAGPDPAAEQLELSKMPEDDPSRRAWSWSSLTSGKARHAFYVLLLPFMLSNVAGWMLPPSQADAEGRPRELRRRVCLVRIAACNVTVQFATLLALTTVDIFGRQGGERLATDWEPWGAGGAVLLCGVIIAAVDRLTRVRPNNEAILWPADGRIDRVGTATLVDDQNALWTTPSMATVLHHAHVALVLGTVASLVGASALRSCNGLEPVTALSTCQLFGSLAGIAAVVATLMGAVVVLFALFIVAKISWSSAGTLASSLRSLVKGSQWLAAAALVAVAPAWALSPGATAASWMPLARGLLVATMVPLVVALSFLFWRSGRAASLLLLAAGVGALFGAGIANTVRTGLGPRVDIPASFGWLALAFVGAAAGLAILATVRYLRLYCRLRGTPNQLWVAVRQLVARPDLVIAYVGVVGAVGAVALLVAFLRYSGMNNDVPRIDQVLGPAAGDIAWTLLAILVLCGATVVLSVMGGVPRVVGSVAVVLGVVTILLRWSTASGGEGTTPELGNWFLTLDPWRVVVAVACKTALVLLIAWLVARSRGIAFTVASAAAGAFLWWLQSTKQEGEDVLVTVALTLPVGLVLTRLRGALSNRGARKGMAVLWDLGTFWPRWFHPFSPPTYSDTAITQTSKLLCQQLPKRPILVAPHSQGSVIAATAILHAKQALKRDDGCLRRLALLTYGSPLGRHYRALFPSMFSDQAFTTLVDTLGGQQVRWRNLYRASDPIAGEIGIDPIDGDNPSGGLPDPKCRQHSRYWDEVEWDDAVIKLRATIEGEAEDTAAFVSRRFEAGDAPRISHEVMEAGSGPSVILLHELPGVTQSLLALAYRLMASGFRVHVPVLYGSGDGTGTVVSGLRGLWCLRRELSIFAAGRTSPLANWLRALVQDIGGSADLKVGVIGMCLTGNLAIAALTESKTGAAVAAQPSLPFPALLNRGARSDLGLGAYTLRKAVSSRTRLLVARHNNDWICPAGRFDQLREQFGSVQPSTETLPDGVTVEAHDRLTILSVPGRGHSVFTYDANETALRVMVRFLDKNLRAQ